MKNILQVHRTFFNGHRHKNCGLDCKQQDNGSWLVHFWGDHVSSEDIVVESDKLFEVIQSRHDRFCSEMTTLAQRMVRMP